MVPFLSRRSITILVLGLIVGALGGLGFWAISPVQVETEMGWPPISFESDPDLYESFVYIELMPPGADYTGVKTLQRLGEYYSAKMSSTPFLEYLSEDELFRSGAQYYTPEELDEMLRVRYDYESNNPRIQIRITSTKEVEAFFIAGITPEVFKDFLSVQERDMWLAEYQDLQEELANVSSALVEARVELDRLIALYGVPDNGVPDNGVPDNGVPDVEMNLAYVLADSEVRALQSRVDSIMATLVLFSSAGDSPEPAVLSRLIVEDPSTPEIVPPDRMRGRNAILMGAVFGLAIGWVALNSRGLIDHLRPAPATIVRLREEEEEEEETEE